MAWPAWCLPTLRPCAVLSTCASHSGSQHRTVLIHPHPHTRSNSARTGCCPTCIRTQPRLRATAPRDIKSITPAPASPPRPPAFRPSSQALRNFLTAVASHYHTVPYHNFNHVCHVLHATMLVGGPSWHEGLWPLAVLGMRPGFVGPWALTLAH